MALKHSDSPVTSKLSWLRRLPIAAAALAAFCFVTTPVGAQDVPWGHKSDSKKSGKKAPAKKQESKKQESKKQDAKTSETKKQAQKPAKQASTEKGAQKKAPPAKSDTKKAANAPATKTEPAKTEPAKTEPAIAEPAKTEPAKADPDKPKVELQEVNLLDHFKKELEPHGKWVDDESYGDVWIPNPATVGKEWAPYRDFGHWALTDKGQWAWVSDMKWGNIPFHYGRWVWSPKKSWMWVPGTEHAPAWVVWRVADDNRKFVGWAPMAPEAKGDIKTVLPYYFVPTRYLFSPHLDKFVIANPRLAKKMFEASHPFGGHASAPGGSGMQAASPSFKDVMVPDFAMPKTKLSSENEAVAPVLGLVQAEAEEVPLASEAKAEKGDDEGRFATPPPDDQPLKAEKNKKRAPKARRARRYRSWNQNRPRYRCWWTNTRPRIWRCGY